MRRATLILALSALLAGGIFQGCVRRPLEEEFFNTALIPVTVDWSNSNIPVDPQVPSGGEWVHRVSLRFYPQDGSPIFERYLEGNVFEGEIEVPVGRYKVIVMNESVNDVRYWEESITFADADDFDRFSATIVPLSPATIAMYNPHYTPAEGEKVNVEPLRLASWSLDDFEVTERMVLVSRGYKPTRGTKEGEPLPVEDDLEALLDIPMRRLTYNVNVTMHVNNLVSAQSIHSALRGLSDKVYIASAQREQHPTTHVFPMNGRQYDPGGHNGITSRSFLSFGRLPVENPNTYTLACNILLASGDMHTGGRIVFDVTNQVLEDPGPDIDIVVEGEASLDLPYIEGGGITVNPWDDEDIDLN